MKLEELFGNWDGVPSLHPERKGQLERAPGNKDNWVERRGGLPTYINSIATALKRKHPQWSISRVIATAVNMCKKMCATGRTMNGKVKVSKAVQAAACAAIASWNRKKASAAEEDENGGILFEQTDEEIIHDLYGEEGGEVPTMSVDFDELQGIAEQAYMSNIAISTPIVDFLDDMQNQGGGKYRKQIFRTGRIYINKLGKHLDITKETLKSMYDNFYAGALDTVNLIYGHDDGDQYRNYAGKVEDLHLSDDGNSLEATISVTDELDKIIKHNDKAPVSIAMHPSYVREGDNRTFGPTLLHVGLVSRAKVWAMDKWKKALALSEDERLRFGVVDSLELFEAEFETVEDETGGKEEMSGQETITLSESELQAKIDAAVRNETSGIRKEAHKAKVDGLIKEFKEEGVAAAVADTAAVLLYSLPENSEKKLTFGEGEDKEELTPYAAITRILDSCKGMVEMGEQGSSREPNEDISDEFSEEEISFWTD